MWYPSPHCDFSLGYNVVTLILKLDGEHLPCVSRRRATLEGDRVLKDSILQGSPLSRGSLDQASVCLTRSIFPLDEVKHEMCELIWYLSL